jgi:chromosome partitioning protein
MEAKLSGDELRAFREGRQFGQQELAAWLNDKLGRKYDRTKISRWETGAERVPQLVESAVRETQRRPPRAEPAAEAKVIAFANQKGGVGKTTSAINTAYLLVGAGYRVLLVDCDSQGSATIHLGIKPEARDLEGKTLTHLLTRDLPTLEAVMPVCDGLFDLIPSSISLAEAEAVLASDPLAGLALQSKIEEVGDRYDAVILDCPPNLGFVSVSALAAADGLVIPSQAEMLSVMGISSLIKTVERVRRRIKKPCTILGILPTLYNARRTVDQEMLRRLETYARQAGFRLFPPVRDASDYGKSVVAARPTLQLTPEAPGADSYADVTATIIRTFLKAAPQTETQTETPHGPA